MVRDERAWISGGTSNCKPWLAMFDATTFQDLDVYECRGVGPINVMKALNWPAQVRLVLEVGGSGEVGAGGEVGGAGGEVQVGNRGGYKAVTRRRGGA